MSLLITILILVIVFCLLWYAISIIPFPPPLANVKWVLYVILIIIAVIVLLNYAGVKLPG